MTLTIGSLFAGIGGLELGLERAGLGPTLWQVESDPYCRRVLAHHWPQAKRLIDVRTVRSSRVEPVDLVCGGFPCQDISYAGSGAGLDGARSGLWREFVRILEDVAPRFAVIENVSALRARGLGRVLGDLAALGFDAEWDCLPATALGAPHGRDRVFIVAHRPLVADADRGRPQGEWVTRRQRNDASPPGNVVDGCSLPQWPPLPDDLHAWADVPPSAQPAFCRVAPRLPDRLARLAALGNAAVPLAAELAGRVVIELDAEAGR